MVASENKGHRKPFGGSNGARHVTVCATHPVSIWELNGIAMTLCDPSHCQRHVADLPHNNVVDITAVAIAPYGHCVLVQLDKELELEGTANK